MTKYSVSIPYLASAIFEVEAKSKEEALKIAEGMSTPQVCYSCSNHIQIDGPDEEHINIECVLELEPEDDSEGK